MAKGICSVEGCEKMEKLRRGWCKNHYVRWLRHGDPLAGRTFQGEPLRWIEQMLDAVGAGDGCVTDWPYARIRTYPTMTWRGRHRLAHHVVLELTDRPRPGTAEGRHLCGMGHLGCLHPRHLAWGTHVENEADKIAHGTRTQGTRHVGAKLTDDDVRAIRGGTETVRVLALRYGISTGLVSMIRSRQRWTWLE